MTTGRRSTSNLPDQETRVYREIMGFIGSQPKSRAVYQEVVAHVQERLSIRDEAEVVRVIWKLLEYGMVVMLGPRCSWDDYPTTLALTDESQAMFKHH